MPCFSHDYVCCALPLYNVGIYSILAETFVVAMTTGVLCFASPKILSVPIPTFGPYLLGGLCIVIAVMQLWGLWAVLGEKSKPYRLFVRSNIVVTVIAFVLALAWIALSFARHSTAVNSCLGQFVPPGQSIDAASGKDLCNIFMWVQVGLLLFMWFFVAFAQFYFITMMRIYGFEQRKDHAKYQSVYSTLGEEIALRNSMEQQKRGLLSHERQESTGSKSSGLRNEYYVADEKRYNGTGRYADPFSTGSDLSVGSRHRGNESRTQVSAADYSRHQYPPLPPSNPGSNVSMARSAREPQYTRYAREV